MPDDQVRREMTMTEPDAAEPTELAKRIVTWLQDASYRARPSKSGRNVLSGTSGLNFFIGIYENSVQFVIGMEIEPGSISLADCNAKNRDWRFVKVYLDDDGDLAAEMDVIVDFERDDARESFLRGLNLWDSALGRIKGWMASVSIDEE